MDSVNLASIHAARARIGEAVLYSPCHRSHHLSRLTGLPLYLKFENLQRTGSFKERGALNKLLTLGAAERGRGVITASTGNHGQAVAFHAAALGIRAEIVMPVTASQAQVAATRGCGAEVILHGDSYAEACEEAQRRKVEQSRVWIHAFDDVQVICGQGTLGLELLEQVPDMEAVVLPIGGGGLIGGVACALKETNPEIRVIGVQLETLPSMLRAQASGGPRAVEAEPQGTLADSIAVPRAGEVTFPLVTRYVDEIVTVDEEEIASAMLLLLEQEKTVAEGAGAAALAALLQAKIKLGQQTTAVPICGGNVDVRLLSRIVERGLMQAGRLLRLRVQLQDRPGALMSLTRILARERINIVETSFPRPGLGGSPGEGVVEVTAETRDGVHIAALEGALREAHFRFERIQ